MSVSYSPTSARENLDAIIEYVNSQQEPVEIVPSNGTDGAVIIAADFWKSLQETLFLEQTGTLAEVKKREQDNTGFSAVSDIDWESL